MEPRARSTWREEYGIDHCDAAPFGLGKHKLSILLQHAIHDLSIRKRRFSVRNRAFVLIGFRCRARPNTGICRAGDAPSAVDHESHSDATLQFGFAC